jgi:hypothetical protein
VRAQEFCAFLLTLTYIDVAYSSLSLFFAQERMKTAGILSKGSVVTHSELGSADILARISRVRFDQYLHQSDMENIKVESPGECSPLLASDRSAHGAVG